MTTRQAVVKKESSAFSNLSSVCPVSDSWGVNWGDAEFIEAHKAVKASKLFNFEGCRIPVPTKIRYDRIKEALGEEVSPKELRTLSLLEYGMPINCNAAYGINKKLKNHFSATYHKQAISEYINKNRQVKAILGPFELSSIANL